jgi:hypothetical protein
MLQKIWTRLFNPKPAQGPQFANPRVLSETAIVDHPCSFGYKCNWLAVRTTDTDRLASIFRLTNATPYNWENGVARGYDGHFFISPPIDGWSFIVSRSLPYAEDDDKIVVLKEILSELSLEFGEAQYFGTYRVVGFDCWMKAGNGILERAYAVVDGGNTIVEGEPTPVETGFRLLNTLSEEADTDPEYFEKMQFPDESMTMEVAGAWSIDPQSLDGRNDLAPRLGWVGGWGK